MNRIVIAAYILLIANQTLARERKTQVSLEESLQKLAVSTEGAVVPIMFWPKDFPTNPNAGIIGSAFLIDEDGYFLTAAHVIANTSPESGKLTANIRQRQYGGGSGAHFTVVEADTGHDIALCHIENFAGWTKAKSPEGVPVFFTGVLSIAPTKPSVGTIIGVIGFPLGSWTPALQMGIVSATETVNPQAGRVPAGQRPLLQIGVSAIHPRINKGT
ncbi:MAG: serine protease [Terriglobia bacterium]|jgi:S1-C subfamily serine protease